MMRSSRRTELCMCGRCWSCHMKEAVRAEQESADEADDRLVTAMLELEVSGKRVSMAAGEIVTVRQNARDTQRIPIALGVEVTGRYLIPLHLLHEDEKRRRQEEEERDEESNFERAKLEQKP